MSASPIGPSVLDDPDLLRIILGFVTKGSPSAGPRQQPTGPETPRPTSPRRATPRHATSPPSQHIADVAQRTTTTLTAGGRSWHPHRAISKTAQAAIDSMVKSYVDKGTAGAFHAVCALRRFRFLEDLQLSGLDNAGFKELLSALTSSSVSKLALPRGTFAMHAFELSPPVSASGVPALICLKQLDLIGCSAYSDDLLEWFASAAPHLEELRVSCNPGLARPMLTLPSLRVASLYICASLTDEAVQQLCKGSTLLEDINLWRCASLREPAISGRNLTKVNVSECFELCDEAFQYIGCLSDGGSSVRSILTAGCPRLSFPPIVGHESLIELDLSSTELRDEAVTAACIAAQLLERLDISHCRSLVAPVIGCPTLRTLIATGCDGLSDEAVSAACSRSPSLMTLRLSLCTSLCQPTIRAPNLVEAHLCGCSELQDAAVTQLCASSNHLTTLGLKMCASLVAPTALSDVLEKLDLSYCEKLRAPRIGGRSLYNLKLAGCSQLLDSALEAACDYSPHLRKLDVSRCSALSSPSLTCPALEVLGCASIEPEALLALERSQWWPSLSKVKANRDRTEEPSQQ